MFLSVSWPAGQFSNGIVASNFLAKTLQNIFIYVFITLETNVVVTDHGHVLKNGHL